MRREEEAKILEHRKLGKAFVFLPVVTHKRREVDKSPLGPFRAVEMAAG